MSYLPTKKVIQDQFKMFLNSSTFLTVKEMYEKYPSKYLDWLPMINGQLLSDSRITLEDKILIHNPLLFGELHKLFVQLEET